MQKGLLFILSVFLVYRCTSQVTFEKNYYLNGIEPYNVSPVILNTIDSGYKIISFSGDTTISNNFVISISRFNKLGKILWNKNSDFYTLHYDGGLGEVAEYLDSSLVMLWNDQNSIGLNYRTGFIHTDKNGNAIWGRKYIPPSNRGEIYINSFVRTFDNGLIGRGTFATYPSGLDFIFLLKTDSAGNIQWCKQYYPDSAVFAVNIAPRIIQTPDSGFLFTFAALDSISTNWYGYLMKTDNNGTVQWAKRYNPNLCSPEFTKPQISNGSIYLPMNYNSFDNIEVLKTTMQGIPIWNFAYSSTNMFNTTDGKTDVNGNTLLSGGTNDTLGYIFKIDSLGNILWSHKYGMPDSSYISNLQFTPDGGILGYGWGPLYSKRTPSQSFLNLVKTDATGHDGCEQPFPVSKSIVPLVWQDVGIKVYPVAMTQLDTILNFHSTPMDSTTICAVKPILKPIARIYEKKDTLCNGYCLCFTDSSLNYPSSWSWRFVGGSPSTSNTQNPCNICYFTPGKYLVTLIATNFKGSDTTYDSVTVIPQPIITISGKDSICKGDSTKLTAMPNGLKYLWSTGSNKDSIIVNPLATKTYTLVGNNGFCSVDTTITIVVVPLPVDSLIYNTKVCTGRPDTVTASGGIKYTWSNSDTGTTIILNPTSNTFFSVTVSNGLCASKDSGNIQVFPYPIPTISDTQYICPAKFITISASGGSSYFWSNGDTTSSISVNPVSNTIYKVSVSNGVCSTSDSTVVIINPVPVPNACCNATIIYGDSVQLSASGGIKYLWSPPSSFCDTCPNITVTPPQTRTYTVTVINDSGCISYGFVTIELSCGDVFIPTAFSPNEANNSILYVRGVCIAQMDFLVFDRWGNKVFESQNLDNGWDGTYKGLPMNMGTYVWFLKASLEDGTNIERKGNVTLVR
ncbi:MAG TPA: gliding motility-associated C-terminal domain-containing protein [Bacteroidia bacterium]|nr:gliding motility-associated C-terminal domain-containing protein [Bacteroidia bacterium]